MGSSGSKFEKFITNNKNDKTDNLATTEKTVYNDQKFKDHKKDYGDRIGGNSEKVNGMVNTGSTVSFKLLNLD